MAIASTTKRRMAWIRTRNQDVRAQGIRSAVISLRYFVEVETDPAGKQALLKAAEAIEQVNLPQ